jgi:hypothetical protein
MSPWEVGDWLQALAIVVTVLGAFGGAVWWMSALYGQVRGTKRETAKLNETVEGQFNKFEIKLDALVARKDVDHAEIWRSIHETEVDIHALDKRVTVLEERERRPDRHQRGA